LRKRKKKTEEEKERKEENKIERSYENKRKTFTFARQNPSKNNEKRKTKKGRDLLRGNKDIVAWTRIMNEIS